MRTELKEKSRGVFYRKSKATLHFHEDPAGLFADMRIADVFVRFPVNTGEEREALLERLSDVLAEFQPSGPRLKASATIRQGA